ncbi:hypothetical protein [Streptomyces sp. NPDC012888]|uniref:hypothetical protein n=1 Tax=Streptomyces sp. NPDC012888 TaxID=3364855 RepID=UPI003692888F
MSHIMPGPTGDPNPTGEYLTARERLEAMFRTSRDDMTVWSRDDVRSAINAFRAEYERDVRWEVAKDFQRLGRTQGKLSWGEAIRIAQKGLRSGSGDSKPWAEGGAR